MSIADEPDMPRDVFWPRVLACDKAERVYGPPVHRVRPLVVLTPGAPLVLHLADGRQFVGSSLCDLVSQVEKAHGTGI